MSKKDKIPYIEIQNELKNLKNLDQFRYLRKIERKDGNYITVNGKNYLNLSSNDYLGLATNKELIEKFSNTIPEIIREFGIGSSSSRLLTGNFVLFEELENMLAQMYKREAALVFNSGYHANTGIIETFLKKGDVVFSDKLNHASIIDGIKHSGAEFFRYKHLDYADLEKLLEQHREKYNKAIIITESIFSMDGDKTDLKKLVNIKDKYDCFLMVDEAHAVGVFGENGCGICEKDNVIKDIDIIVGTFGKALASAGAFAICDGILKEYFINKIRPFIFTTALSPLNIFYSIEVIKIIPSLKEQRSHLAELSDHFRSSLINCSLRTIGESQIIPIIFNDNALTLEVSKKLQDSGFWVLPIRPPAVPAGKSRIRISLTASIQWDNIKDISSLLSEYRVIKTGDKLVTQMVK